MREISPKELDFNVFNTVGNEWMLITAGDEKGYNTMTASWGHMGCIWGSNAPTTVVYIRPQRYTKEFVDREPYYTLTVFPEEYRKALNYLGTKSGRDEDKVAVVGLTPVFGEGYTYFEEAKLTIICKKLYHAPLKEEGFLYPETVERNYPNRDFHEMYIGEIVKVLVKE